MPYSVIEDRLFELVRRMRAELAQMQAQLEEKRQKTETFNKVHGVFTSATPDTKDEDIDRQLWAIDPAIAKDWGAHRKALQDTATNMSAEKRLQAAGSWHNWLDWKDPDPEPLSAIPHLFALGPAAAELLR